MTTSSPQKPDSITLAKEALRPTGTRLVDLVTRFKLDVDVFAAFIKAGGDIYWALRAFIVGFDVTGQFNQCAFEGDRPCSPVGISTWLQRFAESFDDDDNAVLRRFEIVAEEMKMLDIDLQVLLWHLKHGLDHTSFFNAVYNDYNVGEFNARDISLTGTDAYLSVAEYNATLRSYISDVAAQDAEELAAE